MNEAIWYYKAKKKLMGITEGDATVFKGVQPNDKFMVHERPKRIYLAIPYTFNPALSHQIANKVASDLMQKGYVVFSPISHSHHIADTLPDLVRTDADWWMTQDLPFVEWADELHVVCIGENGAELISSSKGCQIEMLHAQTLNKPIKVIDYYL